MNGEKDYFEKGKDQRFVSGVLNIEKIKFNYFLNSPRS